MIDGVCSFLDNLERIVRAEYEPSDGEFSQPCLASFLPLRSFPFSSTHPPASSFSTPLDITFLPTSFPDDVVRARLRTMGVNEYHITHERSEHLPLSTIQLTYSSLQSTKETYPEISHVNGSFTTSEARGVRELLGYPISSIVSSALVYF